MRRRGTVSKQEPKPEVAHEIEVIESIQEVANQSQNQSGFSDWIFLIIIFVFLFGIMNI